MASYTDEDDKQLRKSYEALLPVLRHAEKNLIAIVQAAIARIEDKNLVRAKYRGVRVKSVESVRRKAETKGLKPNDACLAINDLVGARIVCNTVEDIHRFLELLRMNLPADGPIEVQDYTGDKKQSGYRGLHINFRLQAGEPVPHLMIPCEVQVRSLLQDAWAELVHADIYKEGAILPEDLRGRTQDLSSLLESADKIASRIRGRVMQETRVAPDAVKLNELSKEGLSYIFADVFGRWPPEYAVQRAYDACVEAGVGAVSKVRDLLSDKEYRKKLEKVYKEEFGLGEYLSQEDILFVTPIAVTKGVGSAIRLVRKQAREEREEIEQIWRSEVLSSLPENMESFIEDMEAGDVNVELIADALGKARKCAVCSQTIVDAEAFLEVIAAYYDVDVDYNLIGVFENNGAECWTNDEHPNLCSYHAYQADKDD